MEDWDDCDTPLVETKEIPKAVGKSRLKDFNIFSISIDGRKSNLVPSTSPSPKLNVVNYPPIPADLLRLFSDEEQPLLPPSFLLSARNKLGREDILATQKCAGYALPYFFYGAQMFPSVLRNSAGLKRPLKEVITTMTPATVRGFRCHALQNRSWPAAIRGDPYKDNIVGMLAFGLPEHVQGCLDRFQGGSSAREVVRARFNHDDGGSCEIDCYIYLTGQGSNTSVLAEDKEWLVSDLMRDPWHLQNLASAKAEEAGLRAEL